MVILKCYSDLELLVIRDMFDKGFDPMDYRNVKSYWSQRL